MELYFNLKELKTVAVKSIENTRFFRIVGENDRDWQPLSFEVWKELRPLRENKKKLNTVFWDLGDSGIVQFLKSHYNLKSLNGSIEIGSPARGFIRIRLTYTHNEVGEPFYIATAFLPKHIISGIFDIIREENWESNCNNH